MSTSAAYPPPPPYYKLYKNAKSGPPPPPPLPKGTTYTLYGATYTTDDVLPSLEGESEERGLKISTMAEIESAALIPPSEPEAEAVKSHKLERKWTFWYDNQSRPKAGAAWGSNLKKAYTFDTVEEFWCLYDQIFRPSKFPANAEFHCFRAGVEPKWEDPECANGGKWSITSTRKGNLDNMWLETLMALIGEQFDDSEEICGVVASVRQRQDKLALWTRTASNEAVQMSIGKKWKGIIETTDKIMYNFHDDSKKEKSGRSSVRYMV